MEIHIAEVQGARDNRPVNKITTWEAFTKKITTYRRGRYTQKEYEDLPKSERAKVKDGPAFIGGRTHDGGRTKASFLLRDVLCIDIDEGTTEYEHPAKLSKYAAVVYSTHSHTTEHPRYRLVMPLSYGVTAREYEAIGRRIAQWVGMEKVDPTTYQMERLMYYPSCNADAEPFVFVNNGEPLDVESILQTYVNYKNVEELPRSEREKGTRIAAANDAQGRAAGLKDPREKKGAVGAWCRTHTISEVLDEFGKDRYRREYTERDGTIVYTYLQGSSTCGIKIYDNDTWLYCNHSSDDLLHTGACLNAFDVARLLKFGDQETALEKMMPDSDKPSTKLMAAYAQKDEKAGKEMKRYTAESMARDGRPREDWEDRLLPKTATIKGRETEIGGVKRCLENFRLILLNDKKLAPVKYDDFVGRVKVLGSLPWSRPKLEEWTDADQAQLNIYMEKVWGIKSASDLQQVFDAVMSEDCKRFHSVRKLIESQEWDGVPRVDTFFIDYLGVSDTPLSRKITRLALCAAVARVYDPGCKFDQITVLVGPQGVGKSTILSRLAIRPELFNDSLVVDDRPRQMVEQLQGCWIVEIAEFQGLGRADMNILKAFTSRGADVYRAPYGRAAVSIPRQSVLFATTNDDEFLRDPTGNRRFWVLECNAEKARKNVFTLSQQEVLQLWAEAKTIYDGGVLLALTDEDERRANEEVQEEFRVCDPDSQRVARFLDMPIPVFYWKDLPIPKRREYYEAWRDGRNIQTNPAFPWCVGGLAASEMAPRDAISVSEIVDEMESEWRFGTGDRRVLYARVGRILAQLKGWKKGERRRIPMYPNPVKTYVRVEAVEEKSDGEEREMF